MNRSDAQHYDVASYALGILDDADMTRFEEHLAGCDRCGLELESLLPVTDLLADVDGAAFVEMEEVVRDDHMLDEMVNAVTYERSRAKARRVFQLAAGVVGFLAVGGVAVANMGGGSTPTPLAAPSATVSIKAGENTGNNMALAETFRPTDKNTGVEGVFRVAGSPWGTEVQLTLAKVKGPLNCQLVAVHKDGTSDIMSTWVVPKDGYGTKDHPERLVLPGASATKRSDIARLEVQSVDDSGRPKLVVGTDV